jgi:hypothetical protein
MPHSTADQPFRLLQVSAPVEALAEQLGFAIVGAIAPTLEAAANDPALSPPEMITGICVAHIKGLASAIAAGREHGVNLANCVVLLSQELQGSEKQS